MDAEQFQGLLANRDAARDAFLASERELLAAVNGNGAGLAVAAKLGDLRSDSPEFLARRQNGNGKAAGIERVKRAVAAAKRSPATKESKPSGGKGGFRNELPEKLLKMLASGNKTLPQLCAPFEKEMSTGAIYQQVYKLRGMNFVDREGDGYCLKPAGREWLNKYGDGK